jgi:hypothetical protein
MKGPAQRGSPRFPLEARGRPSHESWRMADTTTYEIIGDAEYRVFADGWWADVECSGSA